MVLTVRHWQDICNQAVRRMLILFTIHSGFRQILWKQVMSWRLAKRRSLANILESSCRQPYGPLVILQGISDISEWHLFATYCCYGYLLVKYLLILVLPALTFLPENYELLDCFIMGRYRFIGRTNKISNHISIWILAAFMTHRIVCVSSYGENFRLYSLEFLLNDLRAVERNEIDSQRKPKVASQSRLAKSKFESDLMPFIMESNEPDNEVAADWAGMQNYKPSRRRNLNPLFYIRSRFPSEQRNQTDYYLRPNRTSASWLQIYRVARCLLVFNLLFSAVFLAIMNYACIGSIVTNLGFELGYPTCVRWLRSQQAEDKSAFAYIYQAPQRLASDLSIEELPARIAYNTDGWEQRTAYSLVRLTMDMLENIMLLVEFCLLFTGLFSLATLASIDIVVNATQILKEIHALVKKFEDRLLNGNRDDKYRLQFAGPNQVPNPHQKSASRPVCLADAASLTGDEELAERVVRLQATLADHFQLIKNYNGFVAYTLLLPIVAWLIYTMIICFWMGSVRSRAIEFEFVLAEMGSSMFLLALVCSAATVRSLNRQLYPLIAKLMALDDVDSTTKCRWMIIISHYYPQSMFCFTLFNSIEASWFFCLKLFSWIISIFVVLANFFYSDKSQRKIF